MTLARAARAAWTKPRSPARSSGSFIPNLAPAGAGLRCDRQLRQRCLLIEAKQRVPASLPLLTAVAAGRFVAVHAYNETIIVIAVGRLANETVIRGKVGFKISAAVDDFSLLSSTAPRPNSGSLPMSSARHPFGQAQEWQLYELAQTLYVFCSSKGGIHCDKAVPAQIRGRAANRVFRPGLPRNATRHVYSRPTECAVAVSPRPRGEAGRELCSLDACEGQSLSGVGAGDR